MGSGLLLVYAVAVSVLTCSLLSGAIISSPLDSVIVQVTDDNYRLLGTETEHRFKAFIQEYGKEYSTREEYVHRLGIFARNLIRAAEHQLLDPTAVHGVTKFSDLSEEEFEAKFTGVLKGGGIRNGVSQTAPAIDVEGLPESFDWREKGAVTDVKSQGMCGSCWAFSTTGSLEGANFIATGKLLNLSEQQLVDCDHTCDVSQRDACNDGCSGGLMTNAYNYLLKAGGIQEEDSYPYKGKRGECRFNPGKVAVKVKSFANIPIDEKQIAARLVHDGPLAVALNAVYMQTYIGGVSCPLICGKRWINHGVLLVGYGMKGFSILRLSNKPYWIVKNSWGKNWGEEGYYRLCKGQGMCGINTMVSAVMTQAQAS